MRSKLFSTAKFQTVLGFFAVLFVAATLNALTANDTSATVVDIEWFEGGTLTSGQYASGTTNYPRTSARAYTSLVKGAATGTSEVSNFVIRGIETVIDPLKISDDWVRDNTARNWVIGRNKFRFGEWRINHFDDVQNDPKCFNSDAAVLYQLFLHRLLSKQNCH